MKFYQDSRIKGIDFFAEGMGRHWKAPFHRKDVSGYAVFSTLDSSVTIILNLGIESEDLAKCKNIDEMRTLIEARTIMCLEKVGKPVEYRKCPCGCNKDMIEVIEV